MTQCKHCFGPWRHGQKCSLHFLAFPPYMEVRCRRRAYRDNSCEQEDSEPKARLHIRSFFHIHVITTLVYPYTAPAGQAISNSEGRTFKPTSLVPSKPDAKRL